MSTNQKDRQVIIDAIGHNPTANKIINSLDEQKIKSKEVEVDFGSEAKTYEIFEVTDEDAVPQSKVFPVKAIKPPSDGRSVDEVFAEPLQIEARPQNKKINFYIKVLTGSVLGKFIIWYLIH